MVRTLMTRGLFSAAVLTCLITTATSQVDPDLFSNLKWRSVGPYRGGRSLAVAGSDARPQEFYFGATGGGVWKSTDAGQKWIPVSDGFFRTASVGALAVSPSNPDVVYAGMGERDIRGDISHGDGVYQSSDAGKTWRHLGLAETQNIARIVIHPTDPRTVWVAALGPVYGAGDARGIFKSTDGGATWRKTLAGAFQAGAVDLVVDPTNPKVLLAATWKAFRTPWMLNSGGEGSGLWKSEDGGETWADLTRNPGLPGGVIGKIGVTISPANPKRYWATVEALEGGIFRSDDAGLTWTRVNDNRSWRQRSWYYSHVYADPKDPEVVYALNVNWGRSKDGGKSFTSLGGWHGDHHDLWISPSDPNRMIEANDGGASVTLDAGKTWTKQEYPTGQFYHVSTDTAFPYRILGAQQDNSTVRMPSRTSGNGVGEEDWTDTAGGESGYVVADPRDPDIVFGGSYGGDLSMRNHRTDVARSIDPWPDNPMGHGAIDLKHRFQWTFPIAFSPHDPRILYTGSQFVLRSTDYGSSWTAISPDLTRNDPRTMGPSGGPITKDNTSIEYFGTVFTIAETPGRPGQIWAGTDDGRIQLTRNGGKSWQDVTPPQMPEFATVSIIEPSSREAGTAYAAVDNHRNGDLSPHLYRTRDFGVSWSAIEGGLPRNSFARVIRHDPARIGLLYAGTETGVWLSFDDGQQWQPLSLNLPVTPVHDLALKDGDLIAATHGRGFWILDGISVLADLAEDGRRQERLFPIPDSYQVRWGSSTEGRGANPPSGIPISYYLTAEAKKVKVEFFDLGGRSLQTVDTLSVKPGFSRYFAWLRTPGYKNLPGAVFWNAFSSPITLPPGRYRAKLDIDGRVYERTFNWRKDPRLTATDADLRAQYELLVAISNRVTAANNAVLKCRDLRTEGAGSVELDRIEGALNQGQSKSGQDPLNYPIRLNNRLAALIPVVQNGGFRPTRQAYQVFEALSRELNGLLRDLERLEGVWRKTHPRPAPKLVAG